MDKQRDFEKGWEEYKEKRKKDIEELAIVLYGYSIDTIAGSKFVARVLYKKGYRKIPENAVVLSREDISNIRSKQDDNNEIIASKIADLIAQTRKETAEKFAVKLENRLDSVDIILHEDNDEEYLSYNEVAELIDKIYKEITEGEKCQECQTKEEQFQ